MSSRCSVHDPPHTPGHAHRYLRQTRADGHPHIGRSPISRTGRSITLACIPQRRQNDRFGFDWTCKRATPGSESSKPMMVMSGRSRGLSVGHYRGLWHGQRQPEKERFRRVLGPFSGFATKGMLVTAPSSNGSGCRQKAAYEAARFVPNVGSPRRDSKENRNALADASRTGKSRDLDKVWEACMRAQG